MSDLTVFVTGTSTEVGKTWLTARLASELTGRGHEVVARKPVMSFSVDDPTTDAAVLADATGEPDEIVCPPHRRYQLPMAPPMAAEALGRKAFSVGELFEELDLPVSGIAFVEGVGGPRSPLASDGDSVDLVRLLAPDHVVLVAPSRLGVINDVLTCRDALEQEPLVFLNRFDAADELAARTLKWLTDKENLNVFTEETNLASRLVQDVSASLTPNSRDVEVQ